MGMILEYFESCGYSWASFIMDGFNIMLPKALILFSVTIIVQNKMKINNSPYILA